MSIAVLGAGAWGTALAVALARHHGPVLLLSRSVERAALLETERQNTRDLPGMVFPKPLTVSADPRRLAAIDLVLAAVPAQTLRATLEASGHAIRPGTPVVTCAKGIERGTGMFPHHVIGACLPACTPAALSGPSFAADVGAGLPTAVTLAAGTLAGAESLAQRLATPTLRLYHTDDLVGVELGGAAKNVLAIAAGIAQGRGLGASAVAALTARAFAELMRLGRALGARPETLMGLSGLGDLVLTCSSPQSRNYRCGLALGQGASVAAATEGRLVEGMATAPVLLAMAERCEVPMPIAAAVDAVLARRLSVADAIEALLHRPPRAEDE